MKRVFLLAAVLFAGSVFGGENVVYYDLFEEVGWWQPADAAVDWEITGTLPGAVRGKALKILPVFGKGTHRRILLLRSLPFIRAHRIRIRVWNSIPPEVGKIYLRFEIVDANNKVHMLKMYGNTKANRAVHLDEVQPVWGKKVQGSPLPDSAEAGWVVYEVELPQDIDYVYGEGFVDVGYFSPGDRYQITPERMVPIKQLSISLDLPEGSEALYGRKDLFLAVDALELVGYPEDRGGTVRRRAQPAGGF